MISPHHVIHDVCCLRPIFKLCCRGWGSVSEVWNIIFTGQQPGQDHAGLDSDWVSYDKYWLPVSWLPGQPAHSNHQDSSDSGKYFTNIPRENILAQIWEKTFFCALLKCWSIFKTLVTKRPGNAWENIILAIRSVRAKSERCYVEIAVIKLQCPESRQPWSNYLLIVVLNKIFSLNSGYAPAHDYN